LKTHGKILPLGLEAQGEAIARFAAQDERAGRPVLRACGRNRRHRPIRRSHPHRRGSSSGPAAFAGRRRSQGAARGEPISAVAAGGIHPCLAGRRRPRSARAELGRPTLPADPTSGSLPRRHPLVGARRGYRRRGRLPRKATQDACSNINKVGIISEIQWI
jgi:hypothetical protein